mgnify:CR=1 FL=1
MNPIIETIFLLLSFAGFTAGCTMFFFTKKHAFYNNRVCYNIFFRLKHLKYRRSQQDYLFKRRDYSRLFGDSYAHCLEQFTLYPYNYSIFCHDYFNYSHLYLIFNFTILKICYIIVGIVVLFKK